MAENRGRPKKEVTKYIRYKLRLGKEDEEMLNYISKIECKSKAEVLRNAIRMAYNLAKFRE